MSYKNIPIELLKIIMKYANNEKWDRVHTDIKNIKTWQRDWIGWNGDPVTKKIILNGIVIKQLEFCQFCNEIILPQDRLNTCIKCGKEHCCGIYIDMLINTITSISQRFNNRYSLYFHQTP